MHTSLDIPLVGEPDVADPAALRRPKGPEGLSVLTRRLANPRRRGSFPWLVYAVAAPILSATLLAIGSVKQTSHILGLPGSFMSLTAVLAGALGGPLVGVGVALTGGVVYTLSVASSGTRGTWPATAGSIVLWVITGLVSGLIADALRDQVERHRLAALDLGAAQATERSRAEVALLHAGLEASLLPALPLSHPSLRLLTAYRPSEARLQLGGDFFDVLGLSDQRLALIIGDVAGHGPSEAALGARLRAGWQALSLSGARPETILRSLDEMVMASDASGATFATVCLAWIDPAAGRLDILSAGHHPPIIIVDGVSSPLALQPDMPLGTFGVTAALPETVGLSSDWLLFFYTDGLVEGRDSPGSTTRFGERQLAECLAQEPAFLSDNDGLERLVKEVERANGGPLADDVAIVAVGSPRPPR